MCVYARMKTKSHPQVLLRGTPSPCFLRPSLSPVSGFAAQAKLTSQVVPGLSLYLPPQSWDSNHVSRRMTFYEVAVDLLLT